MAFFDKLKEVGQRGLDKAQDLGAQAKIKMAEEKANSGIKSLYGAVGKALIENFPDFFAENFKEEAEKFSEYQAELARLAEELAALKVKPEAAETPEAPEA